MSAISIPAASRLRLVLLLVVCSAAWAANDQHRSAYISIDEIRPHMPAYCLTVFEAGKIEKFDLEVLDVIRKLNPGGRPGSRNAILVKGTDPRFVHTGPVAGCSGSPVYIDGRLAGALAWGYTFSKDALYGVTPIHEMLNVGSATPDLQPGINLDYSRPIDLAAVEQKLLDTRNWAVTRLNAGGAFGMSPLPVPLIASGLPPQTIQHIDNLFEPLGFTAVAAPGGTSTLLDTSAPQKLTPGACLAVPLVTGDITIDVVGTVTEVVGDDVYGFGHSFLGYGRVDLPLATGTVHTVVSSVLRSFKLASAGPIIGALTADEGTAIRGRIGKQAKMVPLKITVSRYNVPEKKSYQCRLAVNKVLTPVLLRYAIGGAVIMAGTLPPEHTVSYRTDIGLETGRHLQFENISTGGAFTDLLTESTVPVALIMNNPYRRVGIASVDVDVQVSDESATAAIWSVNISDTTVKPGQNLKIDVVLESWLADKKRYQLQLPVPKDTPPGKYQLLVTGGAGYLRFLQKAAPYKFIPENFDSLVDALGDILRVKRNTLYCILLLRSGGIALEKAELPDLPPTKVLVLQHPKRVLTARPYQHWIEKTVRTDSVVADEKQLQITVQK